MTNNIDGLICTADFEIPVVGPYPAIQDFLDFNPIGTQLKTSRRLLPAVPLIAHHLNTQGIVFEKRHEIKK